jgi:hypothetical protein
MHAGRLVIFCGAGLSMAPPSSLPAAWKVAEACFDEYRLNIDPGVDPDLRHDLEALAQHFADTNRLQSVFIESLVPWTDFVRPPNAGHAAVADFLVTKSAVAALSANYDTLIERCAVENGFDFQNSLDGEEATVRSRTQGPLLKFHGCASRDRGATVWTSSQLAVQPIADRIDRSKEWMAANLRQKDLLVVGFWTDWEYLNGVLATIVEGLSPLSVTVIDLADTQSLEEKAPSLWALAHNEGVSFTHVQESGADALDELRNAFSVNYFKQLLASGQATFEETCGIGCDLSWLDIDQFDSDTLYGLRRDAEGVPAGKPATLNRPEKCELLGAFHLMLRRAGAVQTPQGYLLGNRAVRVVNGAGVALSKVKARFAEAPVLDSGDIVVAPGATNLPVPSNVVREGQAGSFMRPASASRWFDLNDGAVELGI